MKKLPIAKRLVTSGVMSLSLILYAVACSSPPPTGPTGAGSTPPPITSGLTTSGPPASAGHSLVYANHLGMVVLINAGLGGATRPASSAPTQVWGWTGQEWTLLDSSGPPVRNLAGVTYDTRRQTLVMHGGGYDLGRTYGETWEWSGNWRQSSATGPGARDHTQLAFDRDRGRAVLFGGSGDNPNAAFGDTWEYDGEAWTNAANTGPQARVHHAMHYDASSHRVTLVGGNSPGGGTLGDVWTWDGSRWSAAGSVGMPRSHARMAFHQGLSALVIVGGMATGLDMLVGRASIWTPLSTAGAPGPRYLTDIAYDERRNVLVMFGGEGPAGLLADTWEFDGEWRQVR